jgi:hypothetical protein
LPESTNTHSLILMPLVLYRCCDPLEQLLDSSVNGKRPAIVQRLHWDSTPGRRRRQCTNETTRDNHTGRQARKKLGVHRDGSVLLPRSRRENLGNLCESEIALVFTVVEMRREADAGFRPEVHHDFAG